MLQLTAQQPAGMLTLRAGGLAVSAGSALQGSGHQGVAGLGEADGDLHQGLLGTRWVPVADSIEYSGETIDQGSKAERPGSQMRTGPWLIGGPFV